MSKGDTEISKQQCPLENISVHDVHCRFSVASNCTLILFWLLPQLRKEETTGITWKTSHFSLFKNHLSFWSNKLNMMRNSVMVVKQVFFFKRLLPLSVLYSVQLSQSHHRVQIIGGDLSKGFCIIVVLLVWSKKIISQFKWQT